MAEKLCRNCGHDQSEHGDRAIAACAIPTASQPTPWGPSRVVCPCSGWEAARENETVALIEPWKTKSYDPIVVRRVNPEPVRITWLDVARAWYQEVVS